MSTTRPTRNPKRISPQSLMSLGVTLKHENDPSPTLLRRAPSPQGRGKQNVEEPRPLPWGEGSERSETGEGSCPEFSEQRAQRSRRADGEKPWVDKQGSVISTRASRCAFLCVLCALCGGSFPRGARRSWLLVPRGRPAGRVEPAIEVCAGLWPGHPSPECSPGRV
jgi:hypothetical protein